MYSEENLEESTLNSWRKFYNPGREEVLKLNLYSPEQKNQNEEKKEEEEEIVENKWVDITEDGGIKKKIIRKRKKYFRSQKKI